MKSEKGMGIGMNQPTPVIARNQCAHWFGMTSGEAGAYGVKPIPI